MKKDIEKVSAQDKVKEITDKLEQGIKDVFTSENYIEYLNVMSKFHRYSLNNTILINMQHPGATLVAGYQAWQRDFERHVNAGEKSIKILAPSYYKAKRSQEKKNSDTGAVIIGQDGKPETEVVEVKIPTFRVVSVFDVSQTDGKELPRGICVELSDSVEDYEDFVAAIKDIAPVPIEFENIQGGAKGYFAPKENRIAILRGMSQSQTVKTLIHEVTHSMLHGISPENEEDRKDRNTMEVEAESVAYTVCQHFGIETSDYSFGYIASWSSSRETEELKSSLDLIRRTASKIITEVDAKMLERQREREGEKEIAIERFENEGVPFVETDQLDMRQVEKSLRGVADTLDSFCIPLSSIRCIAGRNLIDRGGHAAMNGAGDLSFLNRFYAPGTDHTDALLYGIGAHEAGHHIVRELIKRSFPDKDHLAQAEMWREHKIESAILREAKERFGSNPVVTDYGSKNDAEKIAEAVADVMAYKTGNKYSQVIVDIIKEHLENPEKEYQMERPRKRSRGR